MRLISYADGAESVPFRILRAGQLSDTAFDVYMQELKQQDTQKAVDACAKLLHERLRESTK